MDTAPALPWGSRVLRTSDSRYGTVTDFHDERRMALTWDGAVLPDPRPHTLDELTAPRFYVFPAVTHCSGCGETVDDCEIEVDDGYTTCCNKGACGPCAPVDGIFHCGTAAPAPATTAQEATCASDVTSA
ncbi:hypothetical protein ACIBUR_38570 [Streptomyces anulatus]